MLPLVTHTSEHLNSTSQLPRKQQISFYAFSTNIYFKRMGKAIYLQLFFSLNLRGSYAHARTEKQSSRMREGRRVGKALPSAGSHPKHLDRLGLSRAKATGQELNPGLRGRGQDAVI